MTGRVEVGFFSFTEVPAGKHHDYNAWHQLDHLPAQHVLDGIARGDRWVCTPASRAAAPVLHAELGRAQYLTLYLMSEPLARTLTGFRQLAVDLRAEGRFFADRESHRFGAWRVTGRWAARRVLVDAVVVPWRPASGVVAVVEPSAASPSSLGDLEQLEQLEQLEGVAGAWRFDRDPELHHDSWVTADERITVAWIDGDPAAAATAIADRAPAATHVAAYETIRPWVWDWFD